MSTYPHFEARVNAIERRQLHTDTRVEEVAGEVTASVKHLSEDMDASFKQLTQYLIQTEEKTATRFDKIENRLDKIENRLDKIENRLDKIETTMATKEDLTAMENRILDTFRQLITTTNPQITPLE